MMPVGQRHNSNVVASLFNQSGLASEDTWAMFCNDCFVAADHHPVPTLAAGSTAASADADLGDGLTEPAPEHWTCTVPR